MSSLVGDSSGNEPDWRIYERFVARLMSEEHSSDSVSVFPNAKLIGALSGTKRQIDVLVEAKWPNAIERRVIVDAKFYADKIDVKDVEQFEGMMRDCRAQHGIIVCPKGYSEAARKRAQDAITIRLFNLDDLAGVDFYSWDPCIGKCSKRSRTSPGLVLYDSPYGFVADLDDPLSVSAVGKCDVCSEFHVWCWDCGKRTALTDEDEFYCDCEDRFWLTAIEEDDGDKSEAVYLLLVLCGVVINVDRRPLN